MDDREVVLVIGGNASGKTTYTQRFLDKGYHRVNRDEIGGRLADIHTHLDAAIRQGHSRVVMDNTFRDPAARAASIRVAKAAGYRVRGHYLDTDKYQCMANAVRRMIQKHGRMLTEQEIKASKDPNTFPVIAIYAHFKGFQTPTHPEGFDEIVRVRFAREWGPEYVNKAVITDIDDTVRFIPDGCGCTTKFPTKPGHIAVWPERAAKLRDYRTRGYRILGASNMSGVAKGQLTLQEAHDLYEHTQALLGERIEVAFCPHGVPPACYCRKPNPGMGIVWIEKYKLNPAECIFVGDMTSDRNFAANCGFQYQHPEQFFAP